VLQADTRPARYGERTVPTYVDRTQVVVLLRHQFAALDELGASLTTEQWDEPTCLPGWSVRDVLSHVIGTESMLIGDPTPTADVSHLHHMRNPIAEANEVWVESMRSLPGAQVLSRFEEIAGRRLEALDAMTQADFDAPSWTPAGPDETYGRFMRIRHFDMYLHEQDIRSAVGMALRSDDADVASSLDEVATGLGYIVGRRASLPEGSRVRIDLSGPAGRTYLVLVEGRAAVVDSFDGPPTVGIELPSPLFLRLTGGRRDPGPPPTDQITFSGDRELGEQLAANLAFTI
jgi:uncharacterized protein (TIGR03083 family)